MQPLLCGPAWGGLSFPPPPPCQGPPRKDGLLPRAGRRPRGGGCGALLTLAEVGEDVVQAEVGGGPAHLGVAEAEAAAAAGRVVGLQVKGPRATPEMRGQLCPQAMCTGGVQGIPPRLTQAQNHQGDLKKVFFGFTEELRSQYPQHGPPLRLTNTHPNRGRLIKTKTFASVYITY